MTQQTNITKFSADDIFDHIDELSALMHACVADGASIGYILPFSLQDSEVFWRQKVLPGVQESTVILLIALYDGQIAGAVQLDYGTPPNQPHRAEVRKLVVHPDFRRKGIARALMAELELRAKQLNRSLLTLDTRTGDKAEPLYASMGYETVGAIPNFCLDVEGNQLDPTTIMFKAI
ncbi:MAG: GNAT family N-acetyltransferase [Hyphomicrobiales bacterium]|nr:MAG: GNAT family N-acetyltransferase [Hyphomicrobiales bacterium]